MQSYRKSYFLSPSGQRRPDEQVGFRVENGFRAGSAANPVIILVLIDCTPRKLTSTFQESWASWWSSILLHEEPNVFAFPIILPFQWCSLSIIKYIYECIVRTRVSPFKINLSVMHLLKGDIWFVVGKFNKILIPDLLIERWLQQEEVSQKWKKLDLCGRSWER